MRPFLLVILWKFSFLIPVFASSSYVREECALVDQYLGDPRACLVAMKGYVMSQLREDPDYQDLLPSLSWVKGVTNLAEVRARMGESFYDSLTLPGQMLLRVWANTHLQGSKTQDPFEQIEFVTPLWSLLFSKELLSEAGLEGARAHVHPIVRAAANLIDMLWKEGCPLPVLEGDSPTRSVKVITLLPPHHVYAEETCLYALSKGAHLLGLSANTFPGHGGIFAAPLLMVEHDRGHLAALINMKGSLEEARRSMAIVSSFCGQMLTLVDRPDLFAPQERPLAIHSAFMLVHESNVHNVTEPFQVLHPSFEGVVPKELNVFEARRENFGAISLTKTYGESFAHQALQDLAQVLCALDPTYTARLIPEGDVSTYDMQATVEAHVALTHWLEDKTLRHIKPLVRF